MTSKPLKYSAYQQAINILSRRGLSVSQLNDRLLHKGYLQDEIDSVIKKLLDFNFINDAQYALSYCKSKSAKYSRAKVKRGLLQAGIDTEVIGQVIEDTYTEDREYQNCLDLGKKILNEENAKYLRKLLIAKEKLTNNGSRSQRKVIPKAMLIKKKIGDRLITKGYPMAVVARVISQLIDEKAFEEDL